MTFGQNLHFLHNYEKKTAVRYGGLFSCIMQKQIGLFVCGRSGAVCR